MRKPVLSHKSAGEIPKNDKITHMKIKKNSIHKLKIDGYSSDGDGIGRIDGIACFVKGALVGETVQVKIIKVAKNCM